jgi:hypothetical protein
MQWLPWSVRGRLTGKEIKDQIGSRIGFAKRLIRRGFLFVSETIRRELVIDEVRPTSSHHNMVWTELALISRLPEGDRSALDARDVYVFRGTTGVVLTLIVCTAEEAKTAADGPPYKGVADCEHRFVSKKLNAFVEIQYPRALLKNWSEIQARWSSLPDSFVGGETERHQSANR